MVSLQSNQIVVEPQAEKCGCTERIWRAQQRRSFYACGVGQRESEPQVYFLQISSYLVRIQFGFVHRGRVFYHFHKFCTKTLTIKSLGKRNQQIIKVISM